MEGHQLKNDGAAKRKHERIAQAVTDSGLILDCLFPFRFVSYSQLTEPTMTGNCKTLEELLEGHHVHSVVDIEITNSEWFQSCLHRCGSKPVYELETAPALW